MKNIFLKSKLMEKPNLYWLWLVREDKVIEIRDFYMGREKEEDFKKTVLYSIGQDYNTYVVSPTIEDYINNRGYIEDIEDEYKELKLLINNCFDFFTREEMEILYYWSNGYEDEITYADEIVAEIRQRYRDENLTIEDCFEIRCNKDVDYNCNVGTCEYNYKGICNYCGDYWSLNDPNCISFVDKNEGLN